MNKLIRILNHHRRRGRARRARGPGRRDPQRDDPSPSPTATSRTARSSSRGGKITAVGRNVAIPAGIRVIDGTGKTVMPGIIDAHSHAALENGINEGSESVTPEVQVQLKNDDPVIYRALAGGVTARSSSTAARTPSAARRA